ncbi:MAG: GNAT family N-acetyltransferase [Lachnospiraceae bacterium]|nr:GNAT family N-acetyltransferase [Lachnospiraceae bacterium]
MKCELLSEHNLALLFDFVDDQNTKYNEDTLKAFLSEKNAFGYIAEDNGKAVGFAYGYVLNEPDGRKTYYLHAIDIMAGYQNLGYGTELVRYVYAHSKSLGCRKMFLLTNTGNVSACRCYEKAGGTSAAADVIMYEYKI